MGVITHCETVSVGFKRGRGGSSLYFGKIAVAAWGIMVRGVTGSTGVEGGLATERATGSPGERGQLWARPISRPF